MSTSLLKRISPTAHAAVDSAPHRARLDESCEIKQGKAGATFLVPLSLDAQKRVVRGQITMLDLLEYVEEHGEASIAGMCIRCVTCADAGAPDTFKDEIAMIAAHSMPEIVAEGAIHIWGLYLPAVPAKNDAPAVPAVWLSSDRAWDAVPTKLEIARAHELNAERQLRSLAGLRANGTRSGLTARSIRAPRPA